jgi:hypothetical protein
MNELKFALCSDICAKQINELCGQNAEVLGAFPKLSKATITFVMSVCPSVRLSVCPPHATTRFLLDGFL